MKVKLVRKANEGFVNHIQKHIDYINIQGCHCFIDEVVSNGLEYSDSYRKTAFELGLKDRTKEDAHSIFVDEETTVYARNLKLDEYDVDEYGVTFLRNKYREEYLDTQFIPMKLKEAVKRLNIFKDCVAECSKFDLHVFEICDWEVSEIIIDMNNIK